MSNAYVTRYHVGQFNALRGPDFDLDWDAAFDQTELLLDELADVAGGVTLIDGIGRWVDEEGEIVLDSTYIIEVGHNGGPVQAAIRKIVNEIAVVNGQVAVFEYTTEANGSTWEVEYDG